MVESVRPVTEAQSLPDAPNTAAAAEPELKKETTIYVRLPRRDCPAMRRVELVQSMFPGEDRLVLYFEDSGKRLGAKCMAHEAFISELCELAGEENVVVREK